MLFRGWKRLPEDLIEMEGPFLETVCVPFVGLAIFLGPLAVAGSVVASFFSSFALALDSGVVVHKVYLLSFLCFPRFTMEDSFCMGLAYILAAVSMFDEYTNDLLDTREGSCFMRPKYRRNTSSSGGLDSKKSIELRNEKEKEGSHNLKLVSHGSICPYRYKSPYVISLQLLKLFEVFELNTIPRQVWGWLFKSCEVKGRYSYVKAL